MSFSPFKTPSRISPRSDAGRGFTLVELLISLAIIVVMIAIIMTKFSAFDSVTLLKAAAYEIALTLRDAQVYSISVRGTGADFERPYGIHFTNGNSYIFFRDVNTSANNTPAYDGGESISTLTTRTPAAIVDICTEKNSTLDCDVTWADVSFRRPEFKALFRDSAGATTNISKMQIKVQSTKNPADIWVVEVGLLGHISVYKE